MPKLPSKSQKAARADRRLAGAALCAVGVVLVALGLRDSGSAAVAAGNGGWHLGEEDTTVECNIERLRTPPDPKEFRTKYEFQRPFIVENWIEQAGMDTVPWTKAELVAKYGDVEVGVGASNILPSAQGAWMDKYRLRDFVRNMMDGPNPAKVYMFDQDNFLTKNAKPLLVTIKVPDIIAKTMDPSNIGQHNGGIRTFTALGATGSGALIHSHEDGWNLQIFGKKAWFLMPPKHQPPLAELANFEMGMPMDEWVRDVWPTVKRSTGKQSCTVNPGELIYIPEGWAHGTVNIGQGIGVAGQLNEPRSPCLKAQYNGEDALGEVKQLLQGAPTCSGKACSAKLAPVLASLRENYERCGSNALARSYAKALVMNGQRKAALAVAQATLRKEPRNIEAALTTSESLLAMDQPDEAAAVLTQCAEQVGATSPTAGIMCSIRFADTLWKARSDGDQLSRAKLAQLEAAMRRVVSISKAQQERYAYIFAKREKLGKDAGTLNALVGVGQDFERRLRELSTSKQPVAAAAAVQGGAEEGGDDETRDGDDDE